MLLFPSLLWKCLCYGYLQRNIFVSSFLAKPQPLFLNRHPFSSTTTLSSRLFSSTTKVIKEEEEDILARGNVVYHSSEEGGGSVVVAVRVVSDEEERMKKNIDLKFDASGSDGSGSGGGTVFGRPEAAKAAAAVTRFKGGDLIGRRVIFQKSQDNNIINNNNGGGGGGIVIAQRPPIAFIMCNFDTLVPPPIDTRASITHEMVTINIDNSITGSIVDCFGHGMIMDPLTGHVRLDDDNNDKKKSTQGRPIFAPIPKVSDIALINTPMLTGITMIDALAPLGMGQNMLLLGHHPQSTSTFVNKKQIMDQRSIAMDTIIHQIQTSKDDHIRCIYGLTSSNPTIRLNIMNRFKEAGVSNSVIMVSTHPDDTPPPPPQSDMTSRAAAEALTIASTSCAIAESFALDMQKDALVVIDDIDSHKTLWDETTRTLVSIYDEEAVVNDVTSGGSSEMRAFYSSLIQRAGRYKRRLGGKSVTLLLLSSLPQEEDEDDEDEEEVYNMEDFEGMSQKIQERISILLKRGIKLTTSNLRRINIPIPTNRRRQNKLTSSLAWNHVDDLISMSDGQIWLNSQQQTSEEEETTTPQPPILDPQRSITRIGIGADTCSRADAMALRSLVGGLRFELSQANDVLSSGGSSNEEEKRQLKVRDSYLRAMNQKRGVIRNLSGSVISLLAAKMGKLEDDHDVEELIRRVGEMVPRAMEEIDRTMDMTDEVRKELEDAIGSL